MRQCGRDSGGLNWAHLSIFFKTINRGGHPNRLASVNGLTEAGIAIASVKP